ncbi:MAG: hypothetical protein WBI10_13490, partial [Syntrophales bacterium]
SQHKKRETDEKEDGYRALFSVENLTSRHDTLLPAAGKTGGLSSLSVSHKIGRKAHTVKEQKARPRSRTHKTSFPGQGSRVTFIDESTILQISPPGNIRCESMRPCNVFFHSEKNMIG